KNLLDGHPLRDPKTGKATGVTVEPAKDYMYVEIPSWLRKGKKHGVFRIWDPQKRAWKSIENPFLVPQTDLRDAKTRVFNAFCEVPLGNDVVLIYRRDDKEHIIATWTKDGAATNPFSLPPGAKIGNPEYDHGLRFVDLDGDGYVDLIFSNEKEYGIYLF